MGLGCTEEQVATSGDQALAGKWGIEHRAAAPGEKCSCRLQRGTDSVRAHRHTPQRGRPGCREPPAGKVTRLSSGIVTNVCVEFQRAVHQTDTGSPVWQILCNGGGAELEEAADDETRYKQTGC